MGDRIWLRRITRIGFLILICCVLLSLTVTAFAQVGATDALNAAKEIGGWTTAQMLCLAVIAEAIGLVALVGWILYQITSGTLGKVAALLATLDVSLQADIAARKWCETNSGLEKAKKKAGIIE